MRWIGSDVAALERAGREPISKGNLSEVAAVRHGDRAAVLLRGVSVVRKRIVRDDVIELPGRLIEPRTPCLAAIKTDDCSLIRA